MKNLKSLRIEKGLSQQEFANLIHASQNTVSQYENGTRKPSYDIVENIADFFEVSVDYLLGRIDYKTPLGEELSHEKFALYDEIINLSEEEQKDIYKFIQFTKSKRQP